MGRHWRTSGAIVVGPGALTAVVAVTLPNGHVALISGGTDGRLCCWNAHTGEQVGRPESVSDRGVVSLATVPEVDGRVRLAYGRTDGSVTVAPVLWGSEPRMSAPAQVDSTRVQDRLGRRLLAVHLGALLSELAANFDSTSAVRQSAQHVRALGGLQHSLRMDDTSRMSREAHVRICGGRRVKPPPATRRSAPGVGCSGFPG
ncbi:MAG TPA: hypothetical protein VN748_18560 [Pseudonocardiaceae bacterium]|jgi:hypothetical protein|nr:hypothetical protein [Pseudonocardiaceae bacterium]